MPVMDEFREERERMKNAPFSEKIKYFWMYYKWHTVACVAGLAILISLIYSFVTHKEMGFYVAMLNSTALTGATQYANDFAELNGIDTKEYEVMFDSDLYCDENSLDQYSVATTQRIFTYLSAGDIDAIVTSTESIQRYSYQDTLMDLREFLTPEEIARYKSDFYYIDKAVADMINAEDADPNAEIPYPEDPFDPTSMEDPIPVGISVEGSKMIPEYYLFHKHPVVVGFFRNTKHPELCHAFLNYILP